MRLEWLEDILAVADLGSLKAASDRRHVSQPAFSRRLRIIEETIGAALFDRSGRPVRLLPNAAEQVERIRALSGELRDLQAALQEGERAVSRRLVLVGQHAITTATAPTVVERLAGLNLNIRLRSANRDECLALLITRQVDLALVYDVAEHDPLPGIEFFDVAPIGSEHLIPVFASSKIDRLNEEFRKGEIPVVAYPEDVFFGDVQRRLVFPGIANIARIRTRLETALTPAALQFALTGVGIAWVPRSLAQPEIKRGALIAPDTLPKVAMQLLAVKLGERTTGPSGEAWTKIVQWLRD